jgi:hypothetical protein
MEPRNECRKTHPEYGESTGDRCAPVPQNPPDAAGEPRQSRSPEARFRETVAFNKLEKTTAAFFPA